MEPSRRQTVIAPEQRGFTLARAVRVLYDGLPWSRARALCESGRVTLDGRIERDPEARVTVGASLVADPTAPRVRALPLPQDAILHLDREVVVVKKPAGLLTLPYDDDDRDSLVHRLHAVLRAREHHGHGRLRVVHRLDKDTTGILVMARTHDAEAVLRQAFRCHDVHRRYLGLAHGAVVDGVHETSLVGDRGDGLRGSWGRFRGHRGAPPADAKRALTRVRALEALRGATLIGCELETGRQHQIRIHLSESGHPLVGETVYVREHGGDRLPAPRIMLHATELGFAHPRTGAALSFSDPAPADFEAVLAGLR